MQYIPPQTFITTAAGFACQDGLLSTDDKVVSYLVAVIVSEVVGEPMSEYLNHKFFKPLGINKWIWEKSPQGYDYGGWGQYCVIITEKHAVVATLSHSPNGARMLNSVWTNIYDIL